MKVYYPTKRPISKTQGFGDNFNSHYKEHGLKSHGADDYAGSYGDTIYAAVDCYLYSTMNMNGSPDQYRAVYTIVDEEDFSYEVTYGHPIDCLSPLKQFIKAGTPIARMGNFGDVFSGGRKVTVEERLAGSHAGTHSHFQVRKCIRVKKRNNNKRYLTDAAGFVQLNGAFYEIVDYDNGNNGCIDSGPFYNGLYASEIPTKFIFTKDLTIGSTGIEVEALQKALEALGHMQMPKGVSYGYFGEVTRAGVSKYQIANGIKPTAGYFGPLTRASINKS